MRVALLGWSEQRLRCKGALYYAEAVISLAWLPRTMLGKMSCSKVACNQRHRTEARASLHSRLRLLLLYVPRQSCLALSRSADSRVVMQLDLQTSWGMRVSGEPPSHGYEGVPVCCLEKGFIMHKA